MSRNTDKHAGHLVIGGPARADLLPPEVGAAAQGRALRKRAVAILIIAVLIVVAAYAGSMVLTAASQAQLAAANDRTQALLLEQTKYAEVGQVTAMLDAAAAAQRVGTSTEIDWKAYLDDIQKSLPSGTLVTSFRAETATPVTPFGQPSVPLQGDRIGEISFTATSVGLPNVQAWLIALSKLHGFVDASPGSIVFNETEGLYQVAITMHIDQDALLLRYDEVAKAAQEQARKDRDAAKPEVKNEPVVPPAPSESPAPPQENPEPGSGDDTGANSDTEEDE